MIAACRLQHLSPTAAELAAAMSARERWNTEPVTGLSPHECLLLLEVFALERIDRDGLRTWGGSGTAQMLYHVVGDKPGKGEVQGTGSCYAEALHHFDGHPSLGQWTPERALERITGE